MPVAIIYGSSMGNTENVANLINEKLGGKADVLDIAKIDVKVFGEYDKLICGTSTWNDGELQEDWDSFNFSNLDLSGKTVALFGLGDRDGYSDTFCDGLGNLYELLKEKGASFVGFTSSSEFEFDASKALAGNEFVGLVLDYDNDSDKDNEARIDTWIESIKEHF
ncbi:MAG: flavodoxin FldA [Campylobacteraceae bacterium]|nr:flavodoxin FldA [Campylobacteraceae bacterium]